MTSVRYDEYVRDLGLDDLSSLSESLENRRALLRDEEKKTVWRIVDRWMCYGNYREEDYVRAAQGLAAHATKIFNDGERDRGDLELHIQAERLPASEYAKWEKEYGFD
ncbi:hypothetical protein [Acinetobacter phage ABPH49]|nr:hypothetical protein [Acinetobacter phage ABPH49]